MWKLLRKFKRMKRLSLRNVVVVVVVGSLKVRVLMVC